MNGPTPRKALSIRSVAALLLAVVSVVPFYNAVAAETCTTYSNFADTGSTAKACKDAWRNNRDAEPGLSPSASLHLTTSFLGIAARALQGEPP